MKNELTRVVDDATRLRFLEYYRNKNLEIRSSFNKTLKKLLSSFRFTLLQKCSIC